jgi:hypothetical protein
MPDKPLSDKNLDEASINFLMAWISSRCGSDWFMTLLCSTLRYKVNIKKAVHKIILRFFCRAMRKSSIADSRVDANRAGGVRQVRVD